MAAPHDARTGTTVPRQIGWLRVFLRWSLRLVLLAIVVVEVGYLLRRPLLEGWLRRTVARLAGDALGARVEVGALRGDWITTVFADGIQIQGGEVLRRLDDGRLAVQVDLLRLLWHGDLAGLQRARLTARSAEVALPTAEPAAASTPTTTPDLGALTRLLPAGAEVETAALTLRDGDAVLEGPLHLHIAPAPTGRARPFAVAAPNLTAEGELRGSGEVAATLRTGDVARLVRFFAPTAELAGGQVEAMTHLRLAPGFACNGRVRSQGLRIADRPVRRATATVACDDRELRVTDLDIETDGLNAEVRGARLPLTGSVLPTAGEVHLAIADLSPFASVLPEPVRAQLPIHGQVHARVIGSSLLFDDSRLDSAAGSVTVHAGGLALHDATLAHPLQFEARVVDFARLPLPADLPLRPQTAVVRASLGYDRAGALLLAADIDADARDSDARTLAAHGQVRLSLQPLDTATCDLELSGDALAFLHPTRVRGTAHWDAHTLRLEDVRVTQATTEIASLDGTVPLGGDSLDLLRAARLQARLHDVDVGAVLRTFALADLDLRTDGSVALDAARLAVDLTGSTTLGSERLTFAASVAWQDDLVSLAQVQVDDAFGGRATLRGSLGLGRDLAWQRALREAADLRLELLDFDPLRVARPAAAGATPGADDGPRLRVSGSVVARTRGAADLSADLHATAFLDAARAPATAELEVHADATTTKLAKLALHAGPAAATGQGALAWSPLDLLRAPDPDPSAVTTADAHADLTLEAITVATLTTWLDLRLPFDELAGTLSGDAHLRGTLAAPAIDATLRLAEGHLRTADGERLDDLAAEVRLTPQTLEVVEARATRGKGPITLSGSARAPGPWWQSWADASVSLAVHGEDVLLQRKNGVKVRADLDLKADGPLRDVAVTGRVGLRDSKLVTRVPFFDLRRTGGDSTNQGLAIPGVALPEPVHARLDVQVATAEPFAVKTNVLEGKLDAQLQLLGTLAAPRLLGTVSGPDAAVVLPGVRLRATTLLLQFTAEAPHRPTLTLNARGRRHGYDVQVNARGPYDRPDIVLHSDPALPPEDLVVLVTTGARPEALRSTAGVGTVLGAYLAEEFADWIFGSESTEAKESFLDRFTIETGTEMSRGGTESIVVEFRVGNRFYLQGERDVYEDINMGVVYRIRFR